MADDDNAADTTFNTDLDTSILKRKRSSEDRPDAGQRPKKSQRTQSSGSSTTAVDGLSPPPLNRTHATSLGSEPLASSSSSSRGPRSRSGSVSTTTPTPPTPVPLKSHPVAAPPIAIPVPPALTSTAASFKAPTPIVISYSRHHAAWLNRLPWGVQWEISRFVNKGFAIEQFTIPILNDLIHLGKNRTAAPKIAKIVEKAQAADNAAVREPDAMQETDSHSESFAASYARELAAKSPWDELDREDEILRNHPYGALGCNQAEDFCANDPDWYGGRVHFTAKIVASKEEHGRDEFRFLLDRPEVRSSNRFMRRFGSRHFIRVRVPKDTLMDLKKSDGLVKYFRRPFIVGGAVFRSFYAKEENVFLVRTNEVVVKNDECKELFITAPKPSVESKEMSFLDFVAWHNDLELNSDQTMAKWAARFALGLSNSVPGIRVPAVNIKFENDIICEAWRGPGKPPSEMQMTDGCGLVNRATMQRLHERFPAWENVPTAVQCRLGGAKGLLLVLHGLPPELEQEPMVWLRPSQIKIKYTATPLQECILPMDTDPGKLTIDVVRASRMKHPARLSTETIINFSENGVPFDPFKELFQVSVRERVSALLNWHSCADNGAAYQLLWDALAKEGGVMSARLSREKNGSARATGLIQEDRDEDDWDDDDGLAQLDSALKDQSTAWWEDPVSGCPSALEETCMVLLDSGFRPHTCAVLKAKLKEVARKVVKTFQARYHFEVPMSCSAFIVPDPYGVLGPGEIHVKSSRRNLPDKEGRMTDIVIGDVLVTRHPCKVPTDVQKVRAVHHVRLAHYCDVIVVSTASHIYEGRSLDRHLASLTGGGDYDGDTMEVFWDPALVQPFRSRDPNIFAVEPERVKKCLTKSTDTVSGYLKQIPSTASEEFKIHSLQKYLLGALRDKSLVGLYSKFWENSSYHMGYDHEDTIFLAYMFCAILDGSKTGVRVIEEMRTEHCNNRIWQSRSPAWKETEEDRERQAKSNQTNLTRAKTLGEFVMDRLRGLMDNVCNRELARIEQTLDDGTARRDEDLVRPWMEAAERARRLAERGITQMQDELDAMGKHVEATFDLARKWLRLNARRSDVRGPRRSGASFTNMPIEQRQDLLRALSREFHSWPTDLLFFDGPSARRVKASYAYLYDSKPKETSHVKWSRFPWDVATRELCEIKAEALGCPKTVAHDFYHWMTLSKSYLRQHLDQ